MGDSSAAEKIAILSDVHGNMTAFDAVLEHIRASGIERIFNLGDLAGKGPRSAEAVDRCRDVCEVIVRGNWDEELAGSIGAPDPWPHGEWHRAQLGIERLAYLGGLPGCHELFVSGRLLRLFHASHISVFHRVRSTDARDVHRSMFTNTDFTGFGDEPQIVGYGDVHTAFAMNFEGHTLFNVGSVGNSLDLPSACYAVLEGNFGSATVGPWSLNFIRLPYDVEAEIAVAQASGMPDCDDYAGELRTAIYRGRKTTVVVDGKP